MDPLFPPSRQETYWSQMGFKWVHKIKHNSDGTVNRFKARLIAKEFTQLLGIDFHEIFSHVVKMVTGRLFIAIAITFQGPIHQLNINNAYFHSEQIYEKPDR